MGKSFPNYLRLHVEETPAAPAGAGGESVTTRLCRSFRRATGWNLSYHDGAPPAAAAGSCWTTHVLDERKQPVGFLRLARSTTGKGAKSVDQVAARLLVEGIAATLTELTVAQRTVWQREAELAANVPVLPCRESATELAVRLEAALRAGAEAIGCDAAGLYLLDDATTELKLRSAWGLPNDRLLAPARDLAGQMADLEALLGHAVVLEDAALLPAWQPPEDFPAAVCVPVSTSATSIGTLWAYCKKPRSFTDRETNLLELTASRIALELERQVLLTEIGSAATAARTCPTLSNWQRGAHSTAGQLAEHWETASWHESETEHGRTWSDCFLDEQNRLVMVAGATQLAGWEATLTVQAARTALRAVGASGLALSELCQRFQQTLWAVSTTAPQCSVWIGRLDTGNKRLEFAALGDVQAWLGHRNNARPLLDQTPENLAEETWTPKVHETQLSANDMLLVTAAPVDVRTKPAIPDSAALDKALAALARTGGKQPAARVADAMRALPNWRATDACAGDRVGLVLKGRA